MPEAATLLSSNAVTTVVLLYGNPCIILAARAFADGLGTDAYLQMFDAAAITDVTLGTTVPDWVVHTDGNAGSVSVGDGLPTRGLSFRNGIVVASTTGAGNATTESQNVRVGII